MSDPVASNSSSLCMYMKNYPGTLVAYVKYFGNIDDNVVHVEMSNIDSKGMTLLYKLQSELSEPESIRVPFNPPLSKYDDAKPRLLSMKTEALKGLGMLKVPQLTTFRFPPKAIMTPFIFLAYFYLLAPPPPGTTFFSIPATNVDAFFSPAHAFGGFTGFGFSVRTLATILGVIHSAEGLYTLSLCRRFVKGSVVTAAYVGCSVLFGVHIWKDLKKRVEEKRTEAATKFE
ncbi:uncharacterized protein BJ212DRAFT_1368588 [Suillus subaureus]|uniref:DUF2470 domain-containing protein n=1 Tax=Suillus subaureus TaxID=48587 RepID=A0A9P7JBL4_9AGAM|nr:uncharacterized protein BJ212DRAFT_1368588 [Suillus subaureus]KAG1812861.1 hypothetical protein BJ212DRAFT_1368588 [Suillus subaureus]